MICGKWPVLGAALGIALALPAVALGQAQHQGGWIAVAINDAGNAGLAYGRPTRELAQDTALSGCGHRDCRIAVVTQARCVSYVYSTSPLARGWSYGADAAAVETAAWRTCRSAAGNACKLYRTLCYP